MVKSVTIICDQSPIGKNFAAESIRLGSGLISLSDIECRVVFRDDAVLFLSKSLNPEAVSMDSFSRIFKLMKLADLKVLVLEESLKKSGLDHSDLMEYEHLQLINTEDLAEIIQNSEVSLRF